MTGQPRTVKARVFRCDAAAPGAGRYEEYEVPIQGKTTVLNVLQYISEHYDGGLSYYVSCRRGLCGGCVVKVDGRARMACVQLVDGDLTIEPLARGRLVKDLLTKGPGP